MGLATVCTAVVCGLLLLYLAAYAHVTRLGIDQANARGQLRRNRMQNEMLQSERDRLQSPHRVVAAALALGMTERGSARIEYVTSSTSLPGNSLPGDSLPGKIGGADRIASLGDGAEQGTHGGTTADSSTAASLYH